MSHRLSTAFRRFRAEHTARSVDASSHSSPRVQFFGSLGQRNFRLFVIGQGISQIGTWAQLIALTLMALRLGDGGLAVGLVSFCYFGPTLVVGAWAGLLADRIDRHRLLWVLSLAGLVVSSLLAAVVAMDLITMPRLYALTAMAGTVFAVESPVRRAFVGELVGVTLVANAVALNAALLTGARVVGPSVAGLLISNWSIAWCFAFNALSFAPQLWLLARINRDELVPTVRTRRAPGQLRAGFTYAWSDPALRVTLILSAVLGMTAANFQVLMPLFIIQDLGASEGAFTIFFTVMSVGSLLGALAAARRRRVDTRYVITRSLLLGAATWALALSPSTIVAVVLGFAYGATVIQMVAGANTVVQLTATDAFQGRILALYSVVLMGSSPVGGPVIGWLADVTSGRTALALSASSALVTATAAHWWLRRTTGTQTFSKNRIPNY